MSPSPDNLCESSTIISKRVKSPEKDLATTIYTDSNMCTLKRLVVYSYKVIPIYLK